MRKVTAIAPVNIALIKYWGKQNKPEVLPANPSISFALKDHYTLTTLKSTKEKGVKFLINGQLQSQQEHEKITKFLQLFSNYNQEEGLIIDSLNTVPTAAGFASSASGFAALAVACNTYFKEERTLDSLVKLTKEGSGSAVRSLLGGAVAWDTDGSIRNIKAPIDALIMVFVVIDAEKKAVSSRLGMQRVVETSPLYNAFTQESFSLAKAMEKALQTEDLKQVGELLEESTRKMHETTLAAKPPFSYLTKATHEVLSLVKQLRTQGQYAYATMDAGPNVKILTKPSNHATVLSALKNAGFNTVFSSKFTTEGAHIVSESISVSTPGKVYLAGEYGVVDGLKAVIIPTKKTLDVSVQSASTFKLNHETLKVDSEGTLSRDTDYVTLALQSAHRYIQCFKPLKPYHLTVTSHLTHPKANKLGLGTSGAVTVGIIEALLMFHAITYTPEILYKLAVLGQFKAYPDSSFGDLATSAYKHAIVYQKFDSTWLMNAYDLPLKQLIRQAWPKFQVKRLDAKVPPFLLIHTDKEASSTDLVKAIYTFKYQMFFSKFLTQSTLYTEAFIKACKQGNTHEVLRCVRNLNSNLGDLAQATRVPLFTESMNVLEEKIHTLNGAMKFSGAGGGDCVLAFFSSKEAYLKAYHALKDDYLLLNDYLKENYNE